MKPLPRLALLASLILVAGCAGPVPEDGPSRYRISKTWLEERPSDIAVLPVFGTAPVAVADALREGLRGRFLELHYAPVRSAEVDGAPADFRPGGPNAVVEVEVTRWDPARLRADGSVRASATLRIFGADSTDLLYEAVLRHATVSGLRAARNPDEDVKTTAEAARDLAERLLDGLPRKGDSAKGVR